MSAVLPLADAPRLRRTVVRTRALRLALAALLLAAVAVAALAGRHPQASTQPYLPAGSDGIVVLDLSASISTDTYARIGTTLSRLAAGGGRYGLVLFSGDAYEALPPGTPARELKPFARFFRIPHVSQGFAPALPTNPWTANFSAGTSISRGLELARSIIARDRLAHPAVLLISDLDDDPGDLRRVAASALALRRAKVPVEIVTLDAAAADERLFARLLGPQGALHAAPAPAAATAASSPAPFPWWLAGAALAAAVLLAAGELLLPPLRLAEGRG